MFESLDKIDIGKLSFENPKRKELGYFDVESEFGDAAWPQIKEEMERLEHNSVRYSGFFKLATDAKIAFPKRFEGLDIPQAYWNDVMGKFNDNFDGYANSNLGLPIDILSGAKVIFPQKNKEIKLKMPWGSPLIKKAFRADPDLKTLEGLKIIYPKKMESLNLEDTHKEIGGLIEVLYAKKDFSRLSELLASYKIIFSEKPNEIALSDEFWQSIKANLHGLLKINAVVDFLSLARDIKIVAAKEIKITDTSFEVIMPEESPELKEDIPKLPVIRKF